MLIKCVLTADYFLGKINNLFLHFLVLIVNLMTFVELVILFTVLIKWLPGMANKSLC